ncbi:MAG: helix-turn-helix domain-containing protein [Candidatus Aminicenantes bacterium]|nr:MAG: helix-turn-helix domain-containing protein [Candidatus Aminicenantes bacterium]
MRKKRGNLIRDVGQRLKKLRKQLDYPANEMASRLGLRISSYYKNESGDTIPGLITLHRLQKDFNISMDWFLFNKGSMYYEEKQVENEKPHSGLEDKMPDVKELLDDMEKDPLLRHKILLHYYEYKKKETNELAI